jgi:hypothetical protein
MAKFGTQEWYDGNMPDSRGTKSNITRFNKAGSQLTNATATARIPTERLAGCQEF